MTEINTLKTFASSQIAEKETVQTLPLHPLEQYAQTYILERKNIQRSKLEITLRIIFALFGAAWGISWMEASAKAAVIFTEGLIRETFATLFKFGIVTTVGADGLWIMLTLGKNLGSKISLEERKKQRLRQLARGFFSVILSLASIIAPVYSAFKYNAGVGQMLAVIIFVVKFAFSLFAYSTLIDQTIRLWNRHFSREKTLNPGTISLKKQMLKNLNILKKNPSLLSEFQNGKTLVQYLLLETPNFSTKNEASFLKKRMKVILQSLIATLIGIVTFTVDTLLITEALEKIFSIQAPIALPFAFSAAVPTLVVMTLTAYRTLGEWLDIFFLKETGRSVFEHYYPTLNKIIRLAAVSIALLAPTAAAYITHDTLTGKLGSLWVWIAIIFMIAARDLFAYFSLSQLSSRLVLHWRRRGKTQKSKDLDLSIRVEELAEKIQALDEQAFEQLVEPLVEPSGSPSRTHSHPIP